MYSESPCSSSDVDCYEECVTTDEMYVPSSPQSGSGDKTTSITDSVGIPKSCSGRILKKGRARSRSLKDKKCSSPLIMKWLGDNYEDTPGGCLPRSVLYTHYQDFCKRKQLEPSSAASFGKIIRLKFPNLRTRRLGTRGQSKYHYYGLAIRETSVYFRSSYSKQGISRFSGASVKRETGQTYNPTAKTGLLLPAFPKMSELNFTKPFPLDKVETFLLMYKAHCQRILDSVVRANFHEIQDFLIHFWQGMPSHILPILSCQETVDLVVVCDFILYATICEVLVPATLQPVSDSLKESINAFSRDLVEWLFAGLQDLPAALGLRKVQTAEMFGKCLRKESSLLKLAKEARSTLRNSETMTRLLNDWQGIEFKNIVGQARCNGQRLDEYSVDLFRELSCELEQMFVKQSSLEVYFEWLDSVIDRRVNEPAEKGMSSLADLCHNFQILWICFKNSIEQEIMMNGKSQDSYRSISLVMTEYVNYILELLQYRVIEKQYKSALSIHECNQGPEVSEHIMPDGAALTIPIHTGPSTALFPPSPLLNPKHNEYFHMCRKPGQIFINEYHYPSPYNPSTNPTILSPGYNSLTDNFCDAFFKNELNGYSYSPCSIPSSLGLEGNHYRGNFIDAPLTPLSTSHSLSSPLSHRTVVSSPELNLDPEYSRPHSETSLYHMGSPNHTDVPGSDSCGCSTSNNSACTSPLTHDPACPLDITTSLELVAEEICGRETGTLSYDYIRHESQSLSAPPSYPADYTAHISSGVTGYCGASANYTQYDFEMLHLMSTSPEDLLTDPFKETKPTLSQLSSPHTPASATIH